MIPGRLLVVDDEAEICEFVRDVAEEVGFEVAIATTRNAVEEGYRSFKPEVVVLDLRMSDGDGIELLRWLSGERCEAQIVLLSGVDSRVRNTAARLGADLGLRMLPALQKPIAIAELEAALEHAVAGPAAIGAEDLRRALESRELFMQYQPKVDLRTGLVWGVEALIRWQHPQHGALSPDSFVPLFEREGLADSMTCFVLQTACEHAAEWAASGLELQVAVNLSPILLGDLSIPDRVADTVASCGLEPSMLTIEVTETAAMTEAVRAADVLSRFRLKGFGISLDDFGTGYSSLIWLYRLPFCELKIDRSFVFEMGSSEEAEIIVRSILDLAHNLGLEVCAEGVETGEILDRLRSLGCERAQGYFLSRPIDAADLPEWVTAWHDRGPESWAKRRH